MIKGFRIFGFLAMSLPLLGTSRAGAAMESFSAMIPAATVPFNASFTLPGFNSNLGTLTGVTITSTISGMTSIDVLNITPTQQSFTDAKAIFLFAVTDPTGGTFNTVASATLASGTVSAGDPFSIASFPGLAVGGSNSETILPANFAAFITNGDVPLDLSVSVSIEISGTGNLYFGGNGSIGGTETVLYTYTTNPPAVPEPSSIALCGIAGFVGLVVARFKRKRAIA